MPNKQKREYEKIPWLSVGEIKRRLLGFVIRFTV